jgi:hypothetical protein
MANYEDPPRGEHDDDSPERREVVGRLFDIFKRAISTGANVIFSPQDGENKGKHSTLELPKEVVQYLFSAAGDMREALLRMVGNEIRRWLEALDIGTELQKILTSTSFEIKTEIRFIPNDQALGVSPSVKAKMRTKRQKDNETSVTEEEL